MGHLGIVTVTMRHGTDVFRAVIFAGLSAALAYVLRVTTGAFKYIRHPMYSSLLLLAWGVFFKHPTWVGGGVVLGVTASLLATAKAEEVENLRFFGAEYRAYMQRTKMFIPFVF